MRRRAETCALLLVGLACGPGSADRTLAPLPAVRIAVSAELERADLETVSMNGDAMHAIDLLLDPLPAGVTLVEVSGRRAVLDAAGADAQDIAARLRGPGIATTEVAGSMITVTFDRAISSDDMTLTSLGLDGGTHVLAAAGLRLEPRQGKSAVALELVPTPIERQWRLLNGGHVDVIPLLEQRAADQLRGTPSVAVAELPLRTIVALQLGRALAAEERAGLLELIDPGAVARVVCGDDCRARLPIEAPPLDADARRLPSGPLQLLYLGDRTADGTAARLISHQLQEHNIPVSAQAVDASDLATRLAGAFELALVPVSADPAAARQQLQFPGYDASSLIPLFNLKLYAAYDRTICGVEPDSVSSWAWLAAVYRCEDPPP